MKNTGVWVTGLPTDVTVGEVEEVFKKCGIIMDDMINGGPRIHLYHDAISGSSASDNRDEAVGSNDQSAFVSALIVYLREESVYLATTLLDSTEFRPGHILHVEPATALNRSSPSASSPTIDKQMWKAKMEKMQSKLKWHDEGVERLKDIERQILNESIVLLYNMFTTLQLDKDPGLLIDICEDVKEEVQRRIGVVKRVFLLEDRQVVVVKLMSRHDACECVKLMNGRWYGGKRVKANIYDGSFKLSS